MAGPLAKAGVVMDTPTSERLSCAFMTTAETAWFVSTAPTPEGTGCDWSMKRP